MTINKFVVQVLSHLGVETVNFEEVEEEQSIIIKIEVAEENEELILSSRSSGVDALQHLVRVIFGKNYPEKKLFIDVNGHRDIRLKKVLNLLQSVAEGVKQTGEPAMINHHLSPSERFFVHKTLTDDPSFSGLESYSVGEGSGRRVVIQPSGTKSNENH